MEIMTGAPNPSEMLSLRREGRKERSMNKRPSALLVGVLMALTLLMLAACGKEQPVGRVFFTEPQDGDQVKSPFNVTMGAEGLVVEPVHESVEYVAGTGHHHTIVDVPLPKLDQPIPK